MIISSSKRENPIKRGDKFDLTSLAQSAISFVFDKGDDLFNSKQSDTNRLMLLVEKGSSLFMAWFIVLEMTLVYLRTARAAKFEEVLSSSQK